MHVLGFDTDDTTDMCALLAAVILAGNVDFSHTPGSTDDSSDVVDRAALDRLASVLQVSRMTA
jgi:myosin heavy subunit